MMLSGVPNFALALGYTNASWTLKVDLTSAYVCRLIEHLDRHGYQAVTPVPPPSGPLRPLIDLKSGYVLRGAGPAAQAGPGHALAAAPELPPGPADAAARADRRRGRPVQPGAGARGRGLTGRGPMQKFVFAGGTAVVTGAAGGIGAAVAAALAARGMRPGAAGPGRRPAPGHHRGAAPGPPGSAP